MGKAFIKEDGVFKPLGCYGCDFWDGDFVGGRCTAAICHKKKVNDEGKCRPLEVPMQETKKSLTQKDINDIIKETEIVTMTMFGKTTIVVAKLPNGFVIVESSSCVSTENYDMEMGKKICMERIENKIWELEGYKLHK